jgi:putative drug exporter of the RND superfamily
MASLTRWVLGHKRFVIGAWIVITIAAFASIQPASDALSQQFTIPGREGFETNREIAARYGSGGDVAPIVPVVTLPEGTTIDSPGVRAEFDAAVATVREAVPGSRALADGAFVSEDRRTAFALVSIPEIPGLEPGQAEAKQARAALAGVTVGGAPVELTGLEALRADSADGAGDDTSVSILLEVLVAGLGALIVLAFVFGSFMAVIPLLMAVVAIPTTFLLVWPLTAVTDVSVVIQFLVALVGLGIAIDYALLVVMRWREERTRNGTTGDEAVANAMAHAGPAVVFSGTTVAIALLALIILPVPFLRSIGIAGMLIPLVSVVIALTLLPVVLATIGPRLDWPRVRRADRAGRIWTGWAKVVVRHRWAAAAASSAVLVALGAAAFSLELGNPRAESLAQSGSARAGLEQLEEAGIGPGPLTPFEALVPDGVALEPVEGVQTIAAWPDAAGLVTLIPTADGSSADGRATLDRIRATAPAGVTIGGQSAQSADFVDAVYGNFGIVVALVAGLTFLLLVRAFRSLLLPLKAVVLNILSVVAV